MLYTYWYFRLHQPDLKAAGLEWDQLCCEIDIILASTTAIARPLAESHC